MTREERCKLAIEKGYTYNPENGEIYGIYNKKIKRKVNDYFQFIIYHNKNQYKLFAHQFAWYFIYKKCVNMIDHINGIKDDNRICNLREVDNQKNQFNKHYSRKGYQVKGYSKNFRNNKYYSRIKLNGKQIHIGTFLTEEEARNAYLQAKEKYHVI